MGTRILVALSGLLVGALLSERRRRRDATDALEEHVRFERLLTELRTTFERLRPADVGSQIEAALGKALDVLDVERAALAEMSADPCRVAFSYRVRRPGIAAMPNALAVEQFPWMVERLRRGESVTFTTPDELPDGAGTDRQSFRAIGTRSLAAVPLVVAGTVMGANYLDVCARARDDADARRACTAIENTLAGRAEHVSLEYCCQGPGGDERWFEMVVEPLRRPEGGAVIAHIDITARRRAEAEARAQREALAHALRLTTVGELVASMTHELSQPLTAIVTTAAAAIRSADTVGRGAGEVVEALDEIAADGKRAIDVIRRLRALFRKDSAERKPVHINEVIRDVVDLVGRDAAHRDLTIDLALAEPLAPVLGDRVQLQQVVLNLLVNAMDAMATVEVPRTITVTSDEARDGGMVEVAVRDRGVGMPASQLKAMFDAFVTTKPEGLGMGLAISRSIVQEHGGHIWATPNDDRGLTVSFAVPSGGEPTSPVKSIS